MSCVTLPTVLPVSPSKTRGQIQVILGPMFSGKSTELMRRVQRFQIAQYKCLVIKYAKDTRYSNMFSTHDRSTMEALPACLLRDVTQEALGVDVIGIDEGQFFPDIVEFSEAMANEGKTVIVAALDGTFQRKAFGAILNLVPLAESVVKLNAVCMECFREAAYTKRLGMEKEVEVIGGKDKYHAVCRLCYFRKASGQLDGLDCKEDKENRPALGKPVEAKLGEVAGTRKPLAPHRIPAN
ncbi:thymidine kinase, cytosolic [Pteronotus mesoamericanus]|uniref:thymidine kinase, cytosolic n=1 Tax=Pteronotus mesoamericanus TaxID=1884717 RepID=UPI0023ECFB3B|nr:thymidine kinase, cytosolic [Pteronotus parnellii mesoamericanus]